MPDVPTVVPTRGTATSHISTAEWQSFELRMRHRRAQRCLLRAEVALEAGFPGDARAALDEARGRANALSITPNQAERYGLSLNRDGQRRTAFELLSYPTVGITDIARIWPEFAALDRKIAEQLEIDAKYAVYLERQASDVAAYRRDESLALPDDLDYGAMTALSWEVRQKLESIRPRTIGQAGRIDGMTPAALTLLAVHARRKGPRKAATP
jgi:tRNA uridine 5-carboxymethylaminomethyl modification enzyme